MAGPIYKLWMFRYTDAWYALSEEEQASQFSKIQKAWKDAGGKLLLACDSAWASEQWTMFGVDEYPDIEAVQRHAELLKKHDHFRFIESVSLLGTKWEPS